jgi:signal transduction histidine kinase/CheY-like chemotaxis protein
MSTVDILIADDHESFRRSLRTFLESQPNWRTCGEAVDGVEAIEKAKALRPDVILMDVTMPRMDGLQATRAIRRELPGTRVIIVSQNDPRSVSRQRVEAGAHGFVTKARLVQDLVPAIQSLLRGGDAEALEHFFPGESQMAQLMRSLDWTRTEVGAPENWPETLRTSVQICLASRHPIVLWWGRSTFTQFYNDAYISFLGKAKHPAFLGRSGKDCWSEIWPTMWPMWEKVFRTGEATWSEDFLYVLNRNLPHEEGYFNFSYSPLRDDEGRVEGIFCACYETTGRVVGERRLRTLRDLGLTVAEAKTAEAACESTANILGSNPADIPFALIYLLDPEAKQACLAGVTGVEAGSVVAPRSIDLGEGATPDSTWPLRRVVETDSAELVSDLLTRFGSLPGGRWAESPETAIVLPVAAAGQSRPTCFLVAAFSPRLIVDGDYRTFFDLIGGHLATAIANARAYEEERKRAEALAEIDRAKTAFFSNVSHEFRTPLTLMLGPLQDLLAKSRTHLSPTARQQLDLVNRNGVRLLRLVNTLLDFSRIEAGRMQAVYQATDLAQFTAGLASVFRSATEKAGLQLVTECRDLGEPVYVDRDMWEKVVLNLISNAFKFTFEGEIVVSVRRVDDKAQLRVRDTGVGIPAEAIPKLFERFHRVPNTRSRSHEGSGIGLALVHELVKLHGGTIRVESSVGQGTTFTVDIPFGQSHLPSGQIDGSRGLPSTATGAKPFVEEALRWLPDGAPTYAREDVSEPEELLPLPRPQGRGSAGRPRILFADDNSDMRQYIARLLAEHYEVETAADGQAALEMALQHPPNLILSDVMMPGLDGFELLNAIRGDERTRRIPVVLLSARAGEESRVEGVQAGADDYLIKPFSTRELLARMGARLEIARMQQEREQIAAADLEAMTRLHELGTLYVRAGNDVQQCLDATVETAIFLTGAAKGNLRRQDSVSGRLTIVAQHGFDEPFLKFFSTVSENDSACGSAMSGLKQGVIEDVTQSDVFSAKPSLDVLLAAGVRAIQCTPLVSITGRLLGTISTHFGEPHRPSERELRLAELLARLAADYLERRHSETLIRESESQQRLLAEISDLSFAGNDARQLAAATARMVAQHFGVSRCGISRVDVTSGTLTIERDFSSNLPSLAGEYSLQEYAGSYLDEATAGLPSSFFDLRTDPRTAAVYEGIYAPLGMRAFLTVPLHRNGTWVGTFWACHHEPHFWTEPTIAFFKTVADRIWVGIENARVSEELRASQAKLEQKVQDRTEELLNASQGLRELSARILKAQDEERRRIARELHDGAGQLLAALNMELANVAAERNKLGTRAATSISSIESLIAQMTADIRTMSHLLYPPLLDEVGLESALSEYVNGFAKRSGIKVSLDFPSPIPRLDREFELCLFRIVQECLTNIHRHSESKVARIRIAREGDVVKLAVSDDGRGVSQEKLSKLQSRGAGVGIRGMRERVHQFSGDMTIESDGSGMRVQVRIPIPKHGSEEDWDKSLQAAI